MTSHPPSGPPSVPPAGPPSGPLSGPSTRPGNAGPPPPPGPPHGGSGGGGSSGGSGGGGSSGGSGGGSGSDGGPGAPGNGGPDKGPWWRSVPKVASVTAILVAIAALAVVLTNRPDDKGDTAGSGGGEVFLQNAAASGPDPFTRSTARADTASASPASLPPRTTSATPEVSGSTPGLYGGTQSVASCDVEQQVRYLSGEPEKNTAFASVLGLSANEVPGYLRSLTPLQLRADTRVTNHGFRNGSATTYQAVLQSGTAVLVDGRGVPRVRCACGNPLTEPVAQKSPRTTGTPWQGYSNDQVVVVAPSVTVVNVFVVYDPQNDSWFARQHGDHGKNDKPTPPPPPPTESPSKSPSTSTSTSPSAPSTSTSPVPCVTVTGTETPTPSDGVTPSPCPSTLSPAPSTSSPSTPPSDTTPSTDTSSPPESPDSSPPPQSPGPESAPVTDGSADLNTSQSASGSSPAGGASSPGSAPVPAPGQDAARWSAAGAAGQPLA
ncbi:DUF6777 domain-containing protein [Streptomyces zaomyceticus]|uniref:DUF6777 domain-containing protein n=1 Tax=Streptomyces zaomyceticus TaxID=68286 RepID=UPI0035E11144